MNRKTQLDQVIEVLEKLVSLLELDPACQWTSKFKLDLEHALQLMKTSFNQDDLAMLSSSIRSVYGGMGSFNDYMPGRYDRSTGKCVSFPWADEFDVLSGKLFDSAMALVVKVTI